MTRNEIKKKIAQLIGKTFEAFGDYKTKEGTELRIDGEKFEVGMPVYVITPEGQLPINDGEYELELGKKIKIVAGLVTNVEEISTDGTPVDEVAEDGTDDVELSKFDEAELADGTIVATDGDFEVGKKLYVKDEAGEYIQAPEGSHTTKSGIELIVDAEGTITGLKRPDLEGEGSLEEMIGQFSSIIEKLTKQIVEMKKEQTMLNEKFSRISNEPAGEKIFDRKGYLSELQKNQFSKLDQMAALRNNKQK